MLQAGTDPNSIRDFLGHASSETTWRYARITPPAWVRLMQMKRKAAEAIAPDTDTTEQWGYRHLLQKHVRGAAARCPGVAGKRVHPHMLRHTTAVHMLQSGTDPNSIRDFLGHASSETTWRYARITMQMKRKAAEAIAPDDLTPRSQRVPIWHEDDAVLAYLESLGRPNDYVASFHQETQAAQRLAGANST